MKITAKQIQTVMALPGPVRYEHFIKMAADQEKVFGLFDGGWAMARTGDGTQVFLLWPAAEYAAHCAVGDWAGFVPKAISIEVLASALMPKLEKDGIGLGVFYTPLGQGVMPNSSAFLADLHRELERYE